MGYNRGPKQKIHEKKVQDLATAIASAERLQDFGNEASFQRKTTQAPNTGGKTYRLPSHRNEGPNRMNGSNDRPSGWTDRPSQNNQAGTTRGPYPQKNYPTTPLQCLLCKCPHRLSYCSHQASLSALQVSIQESNDTGVETTPNKREDQDNPRMGALKFLSALQRKVDPKEIIEKGLMFVDATINSRPSKSTLIDSGATHNFIANQEARKLDSP